MALLRQLTESFQRPLSTRGVLLLYIIFFSVVSYVLHLYVHNSANYIIDEMFHVPQGILYCERNLTTWDSKITTLPGLYIISAALMGPFNLCSLYWMRFTNLIGGIANLCLFVELFHLELDDSPQRKQLSWSAMISGINMGILPPLYFFNNIYYTDTISIMFVLLTVILAKKDMHISAVISGICSIFMRQTNVIWVLMVFGLYVIELILRITSRRAYRLRLQRYRFTIVDVQESVCNLIRSRGMLFCKITIYELAAVLAYLSIFVGFIIFVYMNGGIVIGDKSAHQATVHLPQLFYFSLFCAFFAFPHFILEIIPFLKFTYDKFPVFITYLTMCLSVINYNTLVHPYLLADNRHYTFYIWTRFFGKYVWAKYTAGIVYVFSIFAIIRRIDPIQKHLYLLAFIPCLLPALALQKLLDVRYFFIPFILLRSKFKAPKPVILYIEHILFLLLNFATFYVFFTKDIFWRDFSYPQKLIW